MKYVVFATNNIDLGSPNFPIILGKINERLEETTFVFYDKSTYGNAIKELGSDYNIEVLNDDNPIQVSEKFKLVDKEEPEKGEISITSFGSDPSIIGGYDQTDEQLIDMPETSVAYRNSNFFNEPKHLEEDYATVNLPKTRKLASPFRQVGYFAVFDSEDDRVTVCRNNMTMSNKQVETDEQWYRFEKTVFNFNEIREFLKLNHSKEYNGLIKRINYLEKGYNEFEMRKRINERNKGKLRRRLYNIEPFRWGAELYLELRKPIGILHSYKEIFEHEIKNSKDEHYNSQMQMKIDQIEKRISKIEKLDKHRSQVVESIAEGKKLVNVKYVEWLNPFLNKREIIRASAEFDKGLYKNLEIIQV
jgi:hypothetical protein